MAAHSPRELLEWVGTVSHKQLVTVSWVGWAKRSWAPCPWGTGLGCWGATGMSGELAFLGVLGQCSLLIFTSQALKTGVGLVCPLPPKRENNSSPLSHTPTNLAHVTEPCLSNSCQPRRWTP